MGCVSFTLTSDVKTEVNINMEHLNIYYFSFFYTFEHYNVSFLHLKSTRFLITGQSLIDYQFGKINLVSEADVCIDTECDNSARKLLRT